ncbi:uncharacterized protein Z520_07972 [Fonsecaea multimorphosa CBS 102226]|uniref:Uncharacterized protein n=1 Tax=Fonsecaea multimorphosa CBS 102226 TaxID=1442371 RepID=A0A0D2JZY3_9EURO|nr:uncharacterized protein Z520_07972 [Fonsecaea multimorphosa CBS 102226]KIX96194.1 hypothetical protein Z520_07972 [Fonsecaea multimorphosa CBS 102226]OAL22229.1 hypothetical protein AYO22_07273 [Fonsecaea multimorphosa]
MPQVSAIVLTILGLTRAVVLPRDLTTGAPGRDWQSAVQNINGMNSILTLLPVLTGKVQNIKLIASRSYPASFVMAGIGAGRVLSKLQLGILLWSFELYRNTVAELSYAHDEYVNRFMPKLRHIPSGTAERHTTSLIVNHNPAEAYMVEAWFQARGRASTIRLKQNNYARLLVGSAIYLALYSGETFLAVKNGANGTGRLLTVVQTVCVCLWLGAMIIIQITRGQGKAEVQLNRLGSPEYRCLQIPTAGEQVTCVILSFHLNNLSGFQVYGANYEQPILRVAGGLILFSGILDLVSTVLIVGLTAWAYPWIGLEVAIILTKVLFCLEPTREIEIAGVDAEGNEPNQGGPDPLPLQIQLAEPFFAERVTTDHNIIRDTHAALDWQSTSAGLWIGQVYTATDGTGGVSTRYLTLNEQKKLALVADEPGKQDNQALQREFLAALASVVEANAVPSEKFIAAVEQTLDNIKRTMAPNWFAFGSKDVMDKVNRARRNLRWRRFL